LFYLGSANYRVCQPRGDMQQRRLYLLVVLSNVEVFDYTGWPKKVSHYHERSSNGIITRY